MSPREARLQRSYGYVFQAPALYPWRTVGRNIALPLEIMGYSKAGAAGAGRGRARRWSTSPASATSSPGNCRAACSSAPRSPARSSFDPDLLLMDEPFGALDEIVRDKLNEQLLRLWERTGKTVVFVTHSIPEAVFLSTRIVVMSPRPGRVHDIVACDFPRDRTLDIRETPAFLEVAHRVREGLRAGHSYVD